MAKCIFDSQYISNWSIWNSFLGYGQSVSGLGLGCNTFKNFELYTKIYSTLCGYYFFYWFTFSHISTEDVQREARAGINQEDIQPAGMRVWSDPFAPKPEQNKK